MILRAQNPGLLNCECVCVHVDLSGAEGKWFGGGGGVEERSSELEHKILALHHESVSRVCEECGIRQVPPL